MPFIPHTKEDIEAMLKSIGVASIESLFDEIPQTLRFNTIEEMPEGVSEMSLQRLIKERAAQDKVSLNFMGAGAYEHYIPAAIWEIASRGEWMTCYTPYQAEASQGTLQLLYEYQTMICQLMSMEVSNASLYEGASALAEAILMAVRISEKKKGSVKSVKAEKKEAYKILIPNSIHPLYRQVVNTIVSPQNIECIEIPYCPSRGIITKESLKPFDNLPLTALVIPQPNFFGLLEEVDALTIWAKARGAKVIGLVNPMAMALLKPPGLWGERDLGVDIACGEGQPLGIPIASGGPYFGFLTCKKEFIRQLPGRLVGSTTDHSGKTGFTLTLQAREQHIRRAKATSNICTNQGLLVTAATIYMSLLGAQGLRSVALQCHANTRMLAEKIKELPGITRVFDQTPFFHEIVVQLPIDSEIIMHSLGKQGIQAGLRLSPYYKELQNCLLIAVTETKSPEDINTFITALRSILLKEATPC